MPPFAACTSTAILKELELDLDSKPEFCETCVKAKAKRKPFPKQGQYEYVENTGDKVVGDLMGPMSVTTKNVR